MPQIDILMATYNGGEYIAAQIRSLQNQTFSDWHLIVHDDGSTDDTLKIVNDFCKIDKLRRVDYEREKSTIIKSVTGKNERMGDRIGIS